MRYFVYFLYSLTVFLVAAMLPAFDVPFCIAIVVLLVAGVVAYWLLRILFKYG